MATEKVKFFQADAAALGTLADWEVQTGANPTVTRQRAQALGADGDEIAAVQYGVQEAYDVSLIAKRGTGDAYTLPKVGEIRAGKHVDSLELSYSQTGWPTLNVSAHSHNGTHDVCRTYTPSVSFPARAIGIPELSGVFTCPEGVGMRALNYSLTVNHADENDSDGEHLAGDNYDATETITVEFTGEVTIAELEIGEGWMLPDSHAINRTNTGATTTSVTLQHHLKHDATT